MGALEDYVTRKVKVPDAPAWSPPELSDFRQDHSVLSLDQSLSTVGWICLMVGEGEVQILRRGTMRTSTDLKGWWGNFERARQIKHEMDVLDDLLRESSARWPDAVVLELPPVHGHRTDSSMLAAYEIANYSTLWWRPADFVSIQRSRKILGGSAIRNDKKAGHQALARYIPESATRSWNEHQRDAAINALAHLYDLKQEKDHE